MSKRRFRVEFTGEAVIELDDAVINVVDDEWRAVFYDLFTTADIADHIAYNLVINRASLSRLDGWADMPDDLARIIEEPDWETYSFEVRETSRVAKCYEL